MKILFRKVHRWLGLLMALQIIAWMASGLWFALFPIEEIRGEHLTGPEPALGLSPALAVDAGLPAALTRALEDHFGSGWTLSSLRLLRRDGVLVWRVEGEHRGTAFTRLVREGGVQPMLTQEEARRRALDVVLQPGRLLGVDWVTETEPGSEIRGRALPVWKARFEEPESLNLYLDPWTGEILARRTGRWRIFDFLWMLHIMDFETRDDFNHPLLQIAALLGLVIALSGVVLWALTAKWPRRTARAR
jgi:uncharacterized iron-regulated membrane protein